MERDVIVQGTDGRELERRVHEGVGAHPGLMEVLRNRSGDDFNPLDFLHGLFYRRADPLEAVLCRGERDKNQSRHKQVLHLQSASSIPACPLSALYSITAHPFHAAGTAFQSGSFRHTTKVLLPFSYLAKWRGDRSVHPSHPAPRELDTSLVPPHCHSKNL